MTQATFTIEKTAPGKSMSSMAVSTSREPTHCTVLVLFVTHLMPVPIPPRLDFMFCQVL